jgi:hypothetical protein
MVHVRTPTNRSQGVSSHMTQPTATRTPEPQRLRALERANEIRLARACLKRRIALGEVSAADVLLACPEEARSWPIGELLTSQRRWGTTRCRKFLARNQLVETKPIGTLTDRQRRMLAASLQAPAAVPIPTSAAPSPTSAPQATPSLEMALAVA